MRAAAVDVGSNTLRLLVADINDNVISRIYSDRAITRLAEGLHDTRNLGEEGIRKSVSALKDFSSSMARHGVTMLKAVGTSALRDALNSREFLDMVLRETGMKVEIISGMKEAELTASGVLMGLNGADDVSLIFDIGGGSTEWIINNKGDSMLCGSLESGVVHLSERFIRSDPPSPADIASLAGEIETRLLPLKRAFREQGIKATNCVGTGGTITTLASMDLQLREYDREKVHMHKIPTQRLSQTRDMLVTLPLEKRRDIRGLEPGRADLIIPGILLTIKLMALGGVDELTVSDYGLLEGLIKELNDENSV